MEPRYLGLIQHSLDHSETEFSYEVAQSFWRRLFGLRKPLSADALFFPNCSCVQGFGLKKKIQLVFVSAAGHVVDVHRDFGGYSMRWHNNAIHVLEFERTYKIEIGDQVVLSGESKQRSPSGFSVVEVLLALPILIFCLFALIQIGLLWHARFALQHAVLVAARHASVSHGSDAAIRDALVQGLTPFAGRSSEVTGLVSASFRSGAEVSQGLALGWLRWEVLSPSRQSFEDWGKPADRYLSPEAGLGEIEIPSGHLPALAMRTLPSSGVKHYLGGLPVGLASEQTLLQANTLNEARLWRASKYAPGRPSVGQNIIFVVGLWVARCCFSSQSWAGEFRPGCKCLSRCFDRAMPCACCTRSAGALEASLAHSSFCDTVHAV